MALRGLTWDCRQTSACYSESTCSIVAKQLECWFWFFIMNRMKVPGSKIHGSSDLCRVVSESQLSNMDVNAADLFHFVLNNADTPVCCANRNNDFLGYLLSVFCSFFSVRMCRQRVLFLSRIQKTVICTATVVCLLSHRLKIIFNKG